MSKKPSIKKVTTTPKNRVEIDTPFTIDFEGQHWQDDAAREIQVQVYVYHRKGNVPFKSAALFNDRAQKTPGSQSKFRKPASTAISFTPDFIGTYTVFVIAWNNTTGELPINGEDVAIKKVTIRAI